MTTSKSCGSAGLVAGLVLACATIALPARAIADTVTFEAPIVYYNPGDPSPQTGYFDIFVSDAASSNHNLNNGGTVSSTNGSDVITAMSVEATTSGGITFTNSDDQTQAGFPVYSPATYVFASNSSVDPSFNGTGTSYSGNNTETFPTNDVFLNDAAANAGTTLSAGTPLGLLRVEYTIPAGFANFEPITIAGPDAPAPEAPAAWYDSEFNGNAPLIVNGMFVPLPEPTSIVLLALGALGFVFNRLVNRRR